MYWVDISGDLVLQPDTDASSRRQCFYFVQQHLHIFNIKIDQFIPDPEYDLLNLLKQMCHNAQDDSFFFEHEGWVGGGIEDRREEFWGCLAERGKFCVLKQHLWRFWGTDV